MAHLPVRLSASSRAVLPNCASSDPSFAVKHSVARGIASPNERGVAASARHSEATMPLSSESVMSFYRAAGQLCAAGLERVGQCAC